MADKSAGDKDGRPGERHNQRRKATLDALRKEQQSKERRKTTVFIVIAAVVALAIVGVTVFAVMQDGKAAKAEAATFGVSAADAQCDPEIAENPSGNNDHAPEGERVDYGTAAPPASGRHDGVFLTTHKAFYTTGDAPTVEKTVHALEHGNLVAWYDPNMSDQDKTALEGVATRMNSAAEIEKKFLATPWPGAADNRPALPAGKVIALTRWGGPAPSGTNKTYKQYCGKVSGEAIKAFSDKHPTSDAPEPNAP